MPAITAKTFERLADHSSPHSVSIYMPTHSHGPEIKQDRIRLRNRLVEADQLLEEDGVKRSDREAVLSAARSLLDDLGFWQHQGSGLGLFLADGLTEEVRLPVTVPERVIMAHTFHLRPLIPALDPDRIVVLAFSRKSCRLFEATQFGIEEMEADLPSSFEDVNWFVDRERALSQHPSGAGSHSFHGHDPKEAADEDLRRFLRTLAAQVHAASGDRPLVLMAVDELAHAYMNSVNNGHPIEGTVALNPDHLNAVQIHEAASRVLIRRLERVTSEARAHLEGRLGENKVAAGLDPVLKAAAAGQVAELFVSSQAPERWGHFDPATMSIEHHQDRQPGSVDLVDRATVETIRLGGSVRVLEEMPAGAEVAALLRY